MKVVGIGGSPRIDGNTDILLKKCIEGIVSAGAEAEIIYVRDLKISPCLECHSCNSSGCCAVRDDMQSVYSKFEETDRIIIASPIFFYGVPSGLKTVIDRCQCFWARKYILGIPAKKEKKGVFISVGGTKGKNLFQCVSLTVKYFFDALDVDYYENLFIRSVDKKEDILNHPEELEKAFTLGKKLVTD